MSPNYHGGLRIPNYTRWPEKEIYIVEYAYAGEEEVIQALRDRENLGFVFPTFLLNDIQ